MLPELPSPLPEIAIMNLIRRCFRVCVAPVLCAALVPVAGAGAIYKYRDADGIIHYTDQRPRGRQQVEIFMLFGDAPGQPRTVLIEKRGQDGRDIVAVNKNRAPVEVHLALTEQDNVRPQPLPEHWVVPAHGELKLASLQPLDAAAPLHYKYSMRWQLGDPNARPDTNYVYSPPVPIDTSFVISQGFNGEFSHSRESSRYAIDVDMPIGTAIRAARGGSVAVVRDSHGDGGDSVAYRGQTNAIYILHDDGTFAIYAHLRRDSALVHAGQRVRAGQIIAQSGNTGYSTGPHLHFAVLRNAGMKWQSVPFALASPDGPVTPARGMTITGVPPAAIRVASRDR